MPRILVIEEEQALQSLLAYNLREAGYEHAGALSGAAGLTLALEEGADAILLDWVLPDLPGAEVCATLKRERATRDIPIIFLTSKGDEGDRIKGFELGAADYVVKPFSVRELMLRVRAVIRRAQKKTQGKTIQFGCLRIDEEAHRVWVDGVEAPLTLIEFKLLVALYEHRDRVQTRATLLDRVWGLDVSVTTRTVDTHVKRLRDKLLRAGEYVETVRGIGYRFAGSPSSGGTGSAA